MGFKITSFNHSIFIGTICHTNTLKDVTGNFAYKTKFHFCLLSRMSLTSTTGWFIARERERASERSVQSTAALWNCTVQSKAEATLDPRRVAEGPAQLCATGLNARSQRHKYARLCAPDIWKCKDRRCKMISRLFPSQCYAEWETLVTVDSKLNQYCSSCVNESELKNLLACTTPQGVRIIIYRVSASLAQTLMCSDLFVQCGLVNVTVRPKGFLMLLPEMFYKNDPVQADECVAKSYIHTSGCCASDVGTGCFVTKGQKLATQYSYHTLTAHVMATTSTSSIEKSINLLTHATLCKFTHNARLTRNKMCKHMWTIVITVTLDTKTKQVQIQKETK